ncbi:MAG: histidinol dehydrogenase [Lentisphaerae bacterium]|nr:histidinol dehydrogenase [Lentisphaerota bacterium]
MYKLVYGSAGFDAAVKALYERPAFPPEAEESARKIIAGVRERGDEAVAEYAEKFDHVKLHPSEFQLPLSEARKIAAKLPAGDKLAIRRALEQIQQFAKLTKPRNWMMGVRSGVKVGEKFTPMERVGVYIPGGTAPLVSTVLHTAGIASAAGVKEIVAITPPGNTHPAVMYAMLQAGVTEIWRLGGVYGVAALAVGTQSIRKVEKICGPGNAYVTAAKKLLYGEVGIDLVAGPSEILVIADKSADPEFVAADLLSQAEHGSGLEQAVLVSTDRAMIGKVERAVLRQRDTLKRQATIDKVLANGVFLIEVPDEEIAAKVASSYAPEHLEIQTENPERVAKMITAAGAIFLGKWTPESCGDFCAGPSHVLPTAGSAKKFNGLETVSFFRRTSLVKYSQAALKRDADIIARFGAMEQLDAHGRAGTIRVEK